MRGPAGPIMIGPAGRNMFRPGPAHMCAGQKLLSWTNPELLRHLG